MVDSGCFLQANLSVFDNLHATCRQIEALHLFPKIKFVGCVGLMPGRLDTPLKNSGAVLGTCDCWESFRHELRKSAAGVALLLRAGLSPDEGLGASFRSNEQWGVFFCVSLRVCVEILVCFLSKVF